MVYILFSDGSMETDRFFLLEEKAQAYVNEKSFEGMINSIKIEEIEIIE
jgi:hypothetical protein